MAQLDGSILVVHPDRRQQRVLQRILGAVGRDVVVVETIDAAERAERDGTPAVCVLAASARLASGADELVERIARDGGRGCLVVQDERTPVPPTVFDPMSLCHLVTSSMPVLAEELFSTVQKMLRRDLFGIEKYLAWGASSGETEIVATDDRLRAVADLGVELERMQLGRRQQAALTLAADELILNAVHHAPVDERGERYLQELRRDSARDLHGRERPRLRWGCDGRWFAIGVRDHFGSVDAATLVRHVAKSRARGGQVCVEGPGAGIGLAMTYAAVSQLVFDVHPGRAAEAIALVDVRPWPPAMLPLCASFHLFFAEP